MNVFERNVDEDDDEEDDDEEDDDGDDEPVGDGVDGSLEGVVGVLKSTELDNTKAAGIATSQMVNFATFSF